MPQSGPTDRVSTAILGQIRLFPALLRPGAGLLAGDDHISGRSGSVSDCEINMRLQAPAALLDKDCFLIWTKA